MTGGKIMTRPYEPGRKGEITFLWKRGELLAELIYLPDSDKLSFLQYAPDGRTSKTQTVSNYTPLAWIKSYARKNAIRLPSAAEGYDSFAQLIERVRSYIRTYFESDPIFESVATLYVMHTWIYERFQAVPYLRFCGLPGTGKSRGLETIGSVCYHPHTISGAVTAAPLFRTIEASGGTTLLDEADFQDSDVGTDIMKILNCGYQQGQAVSRAEKDRSGQFVPHLYEVFGPKIISGRKRFRDEATESRCLSYTPLPSQRTDIQLQLPDCFQDEVSAMQNCLLRWRLDTLESVTLSTERVPGISKRMNQIILPLLTIAERMEEIERERYRGDVLQFAQLTDKREREIGSESVEAAIVRALCQYAKRGGQPTCKQVMDDVLYEEEQNIPNLGRWLSPRKVGSLVREMGFETRHTRDGAVVILNDSRLRGLAGRYGIVTESPP